MEGKHMSIADDAAVMAAMSIVEGELRRVNRWRTLWCTAVSALLVLAAVLMVIGLAGRSPIAFVAGVSAFLTGLAVSTRAEAPPLW
jgi:hypothetical protein